MSSLLLLLIPPLLFELAWLPARLAFIRYGGWDMLFFIRLDAWEEHIRPVWYRRLWNQRWLRELTGFMTFMLFIPAALPSSIVFGETNVWIRLFFLAFFLFFVLFAFMGGGGLFILWYPDYRDRPHDEPYGFFRRWRATTKFAVLHWVLPAAYLLCLCGRLLSNPQ